MAAITKILVPVDLQVEAGHVLEYARLLGDQFGAGLHLITVVPMPVAIEGAEVDITWYGRHQEELLVAARKAMDDFVAKKMAGVANITGAVAMGDVADEILGYAKTNGCDLIVIGTHGREGVARIFFGSVAEGVVRRAHCPVLTLHPFE